MKFNEDSVSLEASFALYLREDFPETLGKRDTRGSREESENKKYSKSNRRKTDTH